MVNESDFERDIEQLRSALASTQGLLTKFCETFIIRVAEAAVDNRGIAEATPIFKEYLVNSQVDFIKAKSNMDILFGIIRVMLRPRQGNSS